MQRERSEHRGLLRALPDAEVSARDVCELRIQFDAFDAKEGILGGDEHRAAFAGTDVEKDGALDWCERMELTQPEIEQSAQNAGRDAVVGGEVGGVGGCATRDDGSGKKA